MCAAGALSKGIAWARAMHPLKLVGKQFSCLSGVASINGQDPTLAAGPSRRIDKCACARAQTQTRGWAHSAPGHAGHEKWGEVWPYICLILLPNATCVTPCTSYAANCLRVQLLSVPGHPSIRQALKAPCGLCALCACRQLDMWDEEYDAGKTKKVRSKDRAGADLHAGGNAFQVRGTAVPLLCGERLKICQGSRRAVSCLQGLGVLVVGTPCILCVELLCTCLPGQEGMAAHVALCPCTCFSDVPPCPSSLIAPVLCGCCKSLPCRLSSSTSMAEAAWVAAKASTTAVRAGMVLGVAGAVVGGEVAGEEGDSLPRPSRGVEGLGACTGELK